MWFYLSFLLLLQSFSCENSKNGTAAPLAQSPSIERALNASKSEFRPSPQLETFFEYNKFPVPPAEPEAKTSQHLNFGEQSWTARIKFPTTTPPYQFYNSDKSYNVPPKLDTFQQFPTIDEWNKFTKQQLVQKNQFDFSAPVDPGGPKNVPDYGAIEKPPTHALQGNPWKKIVKFLTAFIPIGLLISALTPTVINVQSVNGTQSRSRAIDAKGSSTGSTLISSLNYFNSAGCDDRILCELVLSASVTQNAEHHVENLLNTFTKEGKAVEKAEEMRKIFEAVKNQNCSTIICKSMKDKT